MLFIEVESLAAMTDANRVGTGERSFAMPLFFAAVSQRGEILVQESNHLSASLRKDVESIVAQILEKVPAGQELKKSLAHASYLFNYVSTKDGLVFLCVSDSAHPSRICFAFLKHVAEHFDAAAPQKASTMLKKSLVQYSDAQAVDKIESIKAELEVTPCLSSQAYSPRA
jgi:hypothetical protein